MAPTITSAPPGGGTVGAAYTHTYTATGDPTIGYTVTAGGLPPGLTLTTTGVLSGTPTTAGTFTGTVRASNSIAPNSEQAFSITIAPASVGGTLTLNPVADSYVNGDSATQGTNYGNSTSLRTDGSPINRSYLRFTVPTLSGSVISATLRVFANSANTVGYTVHSTDGTWGETTINFSNAPAFGGSIGSSGAITASTWTQVNVTSLVTGAGSYNFVMASSSSTATSFASRQSSTNKPELIVVVSGPPAPVAPTITSAAPGGGTVGVAYNHTYTATGSPTITYAATGTLPPGLTLTTAGVLSGTPTTAGTFTGTVTASNGTAPNSQQAFSITIAAAPVAPTITSAAPGGGTVGVVYSHTYTATGSPTITYAATGTLPPGLTLSSAGVLSGEPTTAGTFTGTVTASNGVAPDSQQAFSITIAAAPVAPTITSAAPGGGTVGIAYSHTYTADGDPTITYTLTSGALPDGLTLSSAGVLSGEPTTAGTFTGTVTASNGVAPDSQQAFSITIAAAPVAPTITSAAPGGGTVGIAYSHTYTADGDPTITYTLTSGALPDGLTLSSAGVLSGEPTTAGTFTGTVTASNGVAPDSQQAFSITIAAAPVAPTITSAAPGGGTVGIAYSHTYTADGDPTITYTLTSGALPDGLTLSSAGVLSGEPTTAGTFTGTVTASNGVAPDSQQAFSITIAAAPVAPTITSAAPGGGTVGIAYNHTYTADGDPTITYTLTSGALPDGLTLSSAGVLSGNRRRQGPSPGQ